MVVRVYLGCRHEGNVVDGVIGFLVLVRTARERDELDGKGQTLAMAGEGSGEDAAQSGFTCWW